MKLLLIALFVVTTQAKPFQFYGYPQVVYQDYQEFQPVQNVQDFVKTPYEYAPVTYNQIISTYEGPQDHFVQDFNTQPEIIEAPDFTTYDSYELSDHYHYNVNPQEYVVETYYPENSVIETYGEPQDLNDFVVETYETEDTEEDFAIPVENIETKVGGAVIVESDGPTTIIGGTVPFAPAPVVENTPPLVSVVQVDNQSGVEEDVFEVATENGNFKTLLKIAKDIDLVDTLKEEKVKAFTIFAPNDDAFAKLPEGTLDKLSDEEKKAIALRHIVIYTIPINQLYFGTLNTMGDDIEITTLDGGHQIRFNDGVSNVIKSDVYAKNGVIHVIDKVIM